MRNTKFFYIAIYIANQLTIWNVFYYGSGPSHYLHLMTLLQEINEKYLLGLSFFILWLTDPPTLPQ